jgi:hypothetical protein
MESKGSQRFQLSLPNSKWKHLTSRAVQALKDPRIIRASLIYRLAQTKFRFWIYPSYWKYLGKSVLSPSWKQDASTKPLVSNLPDTDSRRYIAAIPNQWAGIGHQFTILNTALIFAQRYNLQFVYYPLSGGWDQVFGLGEGETQYLDLMVPFSQVLKDSSLQLVNLPRTNTNDDVENSNMIRKDDPEGDKVLDGIINAVCTENNILFHLQEEQNICDQTLSADILRKKYRDQRNKYPIKNDFDFEKINVAVHIRRGDVVKWKQEKTANWKARWLENSYFIEVLKKVYQGIQSKPIAVHVYSQGSIEEFEEFKQFPEVIFHLDEDAFQTFHGMVLSDILVTSPSDFSYIAGILSKGIKIAKMPYWHFVPQNQEWVHADQDSNFDFAPLMSRFCN